MIEIPFSHLCEVCDREDVITSSEAYASGWDYPPNMGMWGVVSMRTCPNCPMTETAWHALMVEKKTFEQLSERQQKTVRRIILEPATSMR